MADESLTPADVADLFMMGFDTANPDAEPVMVTGAVHTPVGIFHFARCEECICGSHYSPPEWHGWAGSDDIEHARATGQDVNAIKKQRCACECAVAQ